ncbi:MAG: pyrroline-5-carboxylate reductase [Gemmatimonadota bacterium]
MSTGDFEGIAIIGAGNLGVAIAEGLLASELVAPEHLVVTRRRTELLEHLADRGVRTTADNVEAVRGSDLVLICVQPQQLDPILDEISGELDPGSQVVVSTVSGATVAAMREHLGGEIPIVRAMPNLGIAIRESMTCLAADEKSVDAVARARKVFETVGECALIQEELMIPATALAACGVAFFLRAIRAAAQGGTEIGFHADEAIRMAAQTAKGAADLVLAHGTHPETEIDKVTTPKGCTIAGLNEMENRGFSSAMIRGIILSAERADALYE